VGERGCLLVRWTPVSAPASEELLHGDARDPKLPVQPEHRQGEFSRSDGPTEVIGGCAQMARRLPDIEQDAFEPV
jgi:hypothetical protein